MIIRTVAFVLLILASIFSHAQESEFVSGKYILNFQENGGYGILDISEKEGRTQFDLYISAWDNGHYCSVHGDIQSGRSSRLLYEGGDDEAKTDCVLQFRSVGQDIEVAPNHDSSGKSFCNNEFCGGEAHFPKGLFKTMGDCTFDYMGGSWGLIDVLRGQGLYDEAIKETDKLLKECKPFVTRRDLLGMQLDVADSYFHLNRFAECKKTLEPIEWFALSKREDFSYVNADYWVEFGKKVKELRYSCDCTNKFACVDTSREQAYDEDDDFDYEAYEKKLSLDMKRAEASWIKAEEGRMNR